MFSTSPTTPTALTLALRPASAVSRPVTVAAPAISHFMSSMPAAGLMEIPPESNVTPLPIKASGASSLLAAPFQRRITVRGSFALPCATPSSAPKPSFSMAARSSTSTSSPRLFKVVARSANSTGLSTFAGSVTKSRVSTTPRATAERDGHASSAASTWSVRTESSARRWFLLASGAP